MCSTKTYISVNFEKQTVNKRLIQSKQVTKKIISHPHRTKESKGFNKNQILIMALSLLSGISLISTRVVAVAIAVGIVLGMFFCCMLFIFCNKKSKRRRIQKVLPAGGEPFERIVTMPPEKHTPAPKPPYLPMPPSLFLTSSGGTHWSNPLPPPSFWMPLGPLHIEFTYEELVMATGGFSESNFLGQGGFAEVYKGVLPNGKMVAVKKLKTSSGQGEHEFQSELEIIRRIHHRHLVSLVGYCVADAQRFIVYEFIPNKTLEFHLHGRNRPVMEFPTRLRIALGAAKAIAYLHEDCDPKIIHRDIKSANILIDCNFEAKVADFGLAKFTSDAATHVSTRVMGTFGYLAPEFTATGRLTFQCDVFSYGVVLLELITGRRPVDAARTSMDDTLVKWARPLLTRAMDDGSFHSIADPRLQKQYNHSEMARMLSCAEACIRLSARHRPRMSQVVRALEAESSLSDLNEGTRPGHSSEYGSQRISEDELIKLSLLAEFPNVDRYNV